MLLTVMLLTVVLLTVVVIHGIDGAAWRCCGFTGVVLQVI